MPRKPRKPGFWFWIGTFTVGAFKPGEGKHRINSKMAELYQAIEDRDSLLVVQKSDNEFLRKELSDVTAKNKQLLTALHIETGVNMRTVSWGRESPDEKVDTRPTPVVSTK